MSNSESVETPEMNEIELRKAIGQLQPTMRECFTKLLEARNTQAVFDFLDKVTNIMNTTDDDLSFDHFDRLERDIFKRALPAPSRRDILRRAVYALPGAMLAAHGGLGIADQVVRIASYNPPCGSTAQLPNAFANARSSVAASAVPVLETVGGTWLVQNGLKRDYSYMLEQVAEAIEKLNIQREREERITLR